jgi:hypothetical protein
MLRKMALAMIFLGTGTSLHTQADVPSSRPGDELTRARPMGRDPVFIPPVWPPVNPQPSGPFVEGGTTPGGTWFGAGWRFADGDKMSATSGRSGDVLRLLYEHIIKETEDVRWTALLGTTLGLRQELYIGDAWVGRLDLGLALRPTGPLPCCRLALLYFPLEGVRYECEYDLPGRSWVQGWLFAP